MTSEALSFDQLSWLADKPQSLLKVAGTMGDCYTLDFSNVVVITQKLLNEFVEVTNDLESQDDFVKTQTELAEKSCKLLSTIFEDIEETQSLGKAAIMEIINSTLSFVNQIAANITEMQDSIRGNKK